MSNVQNDMNKSLQSIFSKCMYEEDKKLPDLIWHRICICERRRNRFLLWSYATLGVISLSGLVIVLSDISTKFSQSGFYEYISLISSDTSILVTYWKEFTLTLTESLPLTSITISFLLLFVLFLSLRRVGRQFKGQLLSV